MEGKMTFELNVTLYLTMTMVMRACCEQKHGKMTTRDCCEDKDGL